MDSVNMMAKVWNVTPFEVLRSDCEHFINALNYLIIKSEREEMAKLAKLGYDPKTQNDPLRMFI